MASQVQIPFEGVILQEHSAPISCPTPNFAKGSDTLAPFVEIFSPFPTFGGFLLSLLQPLSGPS